MKRVRTIVDDSPVSRVASVYEIDLFVGDATKRQRRKQADDWFFGPQGGAYSPTRRAVMVARDQDWWDRDDARVLHEIVHLVGAVPFFDHSEVPEELFLLQWEEKLAEFAGINREHYEFYRGTTKIRSAGSRRYHEVKNIQDRTWWREGVRRATRLELIDGCGVRFGNWPDWRKLSSADLALLLKWREKGFG